MNRIFAGRGFPRRVTATPTLDPVNWITKFSMLPVTQTRPRKNAASRARLQRVALAKPRARGEGRVRSKPSMRLLGNELVAGKRVRGGMGGPFLLTCERSPNLQLPSRLACAWQGENPRQWPAG